MTERGRRLLPSVLSQVFAPIVAVPFVLHAGWPWPVLVPAALLILLMPVAAHLGRRFHAS